MATELLTRDDFRNGVFARDKRKCVVPGCNTPPVDAHHIMERKLWADQGYYMDNGASLCEQHHRLAEVDAIPPMALRMWCKIQGQHLPPQLDPAHLYDKWGTMYKEPNRERVKYPHTPYLTFSPSADEKDIDDAGYFELKNFLGKELVATIKMDGSNSVITREYVAARNGYDAQHKSFDMLKSFHAAVKDRIPPGVMVFGEWLYAKHSIHYTGELRLNSAFMVFGTYFPELQMWGGWREAITMADRLDIRNKAVAANAGHMTTPEVTLPRTVYTDEYTLTQDLMALGERIVARGHEGFVVRSRYPYHWSKLRENLAKYVRANHVQTDEHWSQQPLIRNEIA